MIKHIYHCGKYDNATSTLRYACGTKGGAYTLVRGKPTTEHHWDNVGNFLRNIDERRAAATWFGYGKTYAEVACQECLASPQMQLWLLQTVDIVQEDD